MEIEFEYCKECGVLQHISLLVEINEMFFCKYSTNDCAVKYFEKLEKEDDRH